MNRSIGSLVAQRSSGIPLSRMHPSHPTLATCNGQLVLSVADTSQVGEARRSASALAANAGFDETRVAELAIIVTELATNLARHGKGGELILRQLTSTLHSPSDFGLEVLALDRGPGIKDIGRALRDGFSTAGSAGTGLGAVGRIAASWDVYSSPNSGTAIVARIWRDAPERLDGTADRAGGLMSLGVVSVPYPGENCCGDGWDMVDDPASGRTVIMVVDGLGHGALAAEAARVAAVTFREHAARPSSTTTGIVQALHTAMRSTRGGAVAVAEIARDRNELRFCGVGNIAAMLVRADGKTQSLVSQNGTAGVEVRRVQQFVYPWTTLPRGAVGLPAQQLMMHSDGLTSRWQLVEYPGLSHRHPSLIAGVLFRDHRRGRDDATVLVARDQVLAANGPDTQPAAGAPAEPPTLN